jgi:Ca-activated chloride channel family protein
MRFAHPWILILTPVAVALLWLCWELNRRRLERRKAVFTGGPGRLWAESNASRGARRAHLVLTLLTLTFLLAALARPLWFQKNDRAELQGIPYLIALDASRSMLATDVRPSRWAMATNSIDRFLASTRSDRIGLITFSGVAYLNAPLTFDTLALRMMLRYLDPNTLEDPGSSLTSALDRGGRYFETNKISPRLIVLISDGEDLTGNPVESARRLARQYDLKVVTLGIGTPGGGKVPSARGGAAKNSFGQEVISRLNESNLQRVAAATGGRYFRFGERGEGLDQFRREVLEPMTEAAAREDLKNYRELFVLPLGLAIACLLGQIALSAERRLTPRRPVPLVRRNETIRPAPTSAS